MLWGQFSHLCVLLSWFCGEGTWDTLVVSSWPFGSEHRARIQPGFALHQSLRIYWIWTFHCLFFFSFRNKSGTWHCLGIPELIKIIRFFIEGTFISRNNFIQFSVKGNFATVDISNLFYDKGCLSSCLPLSSQSYLQCGFPSLYVFSFI